MAFRPFGISAFFVALQCSLAFAGNNGPLSKGYPQPVPGVLSFLSTRQSQSGSDSEIVGFATAINDRSDVVGSYVEGQEGEGLYRGFFWSRGSWTDLGGSGWNIVPYDINEHGEVVGVRYRDGEDSHAFLWRDGDMTDLGPVIDNPGFDPRLMRLAINNKGQVLIARKDQVSPDIVRAYLWEDGVLTDLGSLGGKFTTAFDVNDHGEVTGFSESGSDGGLHVFLWQRGAMTDLGLLATPNFPRIFVNERGQVAYVDHSNSFEELILITRGVRAVRPGLGRLLQVNELDDQGGVAGWSSFADTTQHAVYWDPDGNVHDINPHGLAWSEAIGTDKSGGVVIRGGSGSFKSYLWRDGQYMDLDSLSSDVYASAVNRHGQIVGGTSRGLGAFLWEDGVLIDLLASPASPKRPTSMKLHAGTSPVDGMELSFVRPSRSAIDLAVRVPGGASWNVVLFDVQGRRIREIGEGVGPGSVRWHGTAASGARVLPGVYWARLTTGSGSMARRLLWMGN